jgi:hypothetical protein
VKDKIQKCYLDIGFENVKSTLHLIKDDTISYLKKKFLGDAKASEVFEKKLKAEIKTLSLHVIKEAQQKIDE